MGGAPSSHHSSPHEMSMMSEQHYPGGVDMNSIFKGIPKMIQVADDMHRMTNYIMDLRNMTLALVAISVIGMIGFLILRAVSGRNNRRRKRSFVRHAEEYPPQGMQRYYYQSQYAPEPWDRPKSNFSQHSVVEEKKPIESSRDSPENRRNGTLPYKTFTNDEQLSPIVDKKAPSSTENTFSRYQPPAQKRSLEPIKLLVEDLPYADS